MDNYVVSERNGSVLVCVSLTGYVERLVVVTVFTVGGSAVGEYTLVWWICIMVIYDNYTLQLD